MLPMWTSRSRKEILSNGEWNRFKRSVIYTAKGTSSRFWWDGCTTVSFFRSEVSSSGTQGNQQPQSTQTRIFALTSGEAQANPDTMTSIMIVFGIPAQILFDTRSSRSFVSTTFSLHANRELVPLKNKLGFNMPLGEQILRTSVFKGCEIVVEGEVLKANLIPLEMTDFNVILGMD